jgi:hypothetical protein
VLPAAVAEGAGDELPPARRGVIEVQQLGPALVQHVVEQEHRQVGHDQQEQCIAGLVCGPQLCVLCAACNVNIA